MKVPAFKHFNKKKPLMNTLKCIIVKEAIINIQ